MTFREFSCFAEGYGKAELRMYQLVTWGAWHVEAFHRTKRLPELRGILSKFRDREKEPLTPKELLKRVEVIALATKIKGKNNG